MKKVLLFLLTFITCTLDLSATPTLQISWKFINVIDGYDHLNKIEVYIDGSLISTSESVHESQLSTHTVDVTKGKHEVVIRNYAYYNENWEEHLVSKGYSLDANFDEVRMLKKKNYLTLVWDIDKTGPEALTYAWTKPTAKLLMSPEQSKSGTALSVKWKFDNVNEGYDHDIRLIVYADGKRYHVSNIAKSSVGNQFKVTLPKTTKDLKIVAESFYEGTWEEHSVKNSYSMDAVVQKTGPFPSKVSLDVKFDIKSESVNPVWK